LEKDTYDVIKLKIGSEKIRSGSLDYCQQLNNAIPEDIWKRESRASTTN
jgi:hypothetical protein